MASFKFSALHALLVILPTGGALQVFSCIVPAEAGLQKCLNAAVIQHWHKWHMILKFKDHIQKEQALDRGCDTGNCPKSLLLSWMFCLKYWLQTLEAESSSTLIQKNRWQRNIIPIYTKYRMLQDYSSSPQPKANPPSKGKAPHFKGEISDGICLQNAHELHQQWGDTFVLALYSWYTGTTSTSGLQIQMRSMGHQLTTLQSYQPTKNNFLPFSNLHNNRLFYIHKSITRMHKIITNIKITVKKSSKKLSNCKDTARQGLMVYCRQVISAPPQQK